MKKHSQFNAKSKLKKPTVRLQRNQPTKRPIHVHITKNTTKPSVSNEATVGNVSGVLNIIIQIPIQIGVDAQTVSGSDNNSTTTI